MSRPKAGATGHCQDKSLGARQNAGALPPRRERARARHAPAPLAELPSAVADRAETGRRASAVDEEVKRPRQQDELAGQIVGRQAMRARCRRGANVGGEELERPQRVSEAKPACWLPTAHL